MRDNDINWTKSQMFRALRVYQVGLADIERHAEKLAQELGKNGLAPELRTFLDQVAGTIIGTTMEAAKMLDEPPSRL